MFRMIGSLDYLDCDQPGAGTGMYRLRDRPEAKIGTNGQAGQARGQVTTGERTRDRPEVLSSTGRRSLVTKTKATSRVSV
eukprot:1388964-Amorphochlora_amoeboformis.AAC.1